MVIVNDEIPRVPLLSVFPYFGQYYDNRRQKLLAKDAKKG
jgi:hypothetical protein